MKGTPAAFSTPGGTAPPDPLAAWPRSSQYALVFLILTTLALVAAHVVIGRLTDARPTTLEAGHALTEPLDLNRADFAQLRQLPDVGEKLAAAILDYRRNRGGFGSVEELGNVPGFGRTRVERLRPWLRVEEEDEEPSEEPISTSVPVSSKKRTESPSRSRKSDGLKGVLDLNTASEGELQQIEGLGPVLARRIVEAREKQPFQKVEDLLKIPFIKKKTLDKVRPFVSVKPPPERIE